MSLIVIQPGPLLTIQDNGRLGQRRWGVPASGALDLNALTIANRLVGNPPATAGLEITGVGCQLAVTVPTLLAVTGGDLGAWLDDAPLPLWHACFVRPGQELRWNERRAGGRCYLAVAGGFQIPPSLGSTSALIGGPLPGLLGRALRPGDHLPLSSAEPELARAGACWPHGPGFAAAPTIRLLPGPHQPLLAGQWQRLLSQQWRVSQDSNRMGYRLLGPAIPPEPPLAIPSCGVVPGAIQLPPDGQPIVLLADAQTTGGYPLLAAVIAADLSQFAHLLPGDELSFSETTLTEAHAAYHQQQELLLKPMQAWPAWGVAC